MLYTKSIKTLMRRTDSKFGEVVTSKKEGTKDCYSVSSTLHNFIFKKQSLEKYVKMLTVVESKVEYICFWCNFWYFSIVKNYFS